MQLSIQRLRWVLLAGAVLLIAVLTAFIGYGRYRALKAYRQIIARSGVSITHDSNGVTYSQSVQGRKIFTIRAKSESTLGDGKYALHNAELLLYDRSGHAADHISGSEIEYDENEGIARAKGDVFMDIEPPQGLANGGRNAPGPVKPRTVPPAIIHVRTSGLVYLRKLGIASTERQVEISYGEMRCTAVGAEFSSDQSTVRLLSNVHMDGLAHGKPIHVVAARADMDRDQNIANLAQPVVTSDGRSARADSAILYLRKDGSIQQVQGIHHVVLTSGTQTITANRLDATLNEQSLPQAAKLSGDVLLVDTDPLRSMHGSASIVDTDFSAQGSPTKVVATGAVRLSEVDRRATPRGLTRSMEGARIVALFSPGQAVAGRRKSSAHITQLQATGRAHASGESIATSAKVASAGSEPAPLKNAQVWADDLRVLFTATASEKERPETLYGTGHTKLQQDAPLGQQEISTGASLEIAFAPAPDPATTAASEPGATSIRSAVQNGHVMIHVQEAAKPGSGKPGAISTGTADRATYLGESQTLTLTGDAHLSSDTASVIAPTIALNQRTEDADASGGVQASFLKEAVNTTDASAGSKPEPATHILAATAHFDHATRLATFYGTDAVPARMWQDASQVQAATLTFDGVHRMFSARPGRSGGQIHAIFASNPEVPKPGVATRAASTLRVASNTMDYSDLQREATFTGEVKISGTMGEVRGQHAVVFLVPNHPAAPKPAEPALWARPNPMNGSIDRVVVYGAVELDQPGRHGTGDELLYNVAKGTYVLTGTRGNPPHIHDAQQGDITGTTLVFGDAGSTIVVAGDQGARKDKTGRVRTETYVHSGKPERQQ